MLRYSSKAFSKKSKTLQTFVRDESGAITSHALMMMVSLSFAYHFALHISDAINDHFRQISTILASIAR
ncbi:MAG: hypothetical protein OIF54_14670 [Cohaesibacter sp.]|nr:hypothetical protein [Cohaesibacter sp.]